MRNGIGVGPNAKLVPFRIHENDYAVFKKLLQDDGFSFQSFVRAFVDAYVDGEQAVLEVLKRKHGLPVASKNEVDRFTLSQKERQKLAEQIERAQDKKEVI